jgi:hypothetical protein
MHCFIALLFTASSSVSEGAASERFSIHDSHGDCSSCLYLSSVLACPFRLFTFSVGRYVSTSAHSPLRPIRRRASGYLLLIDLRAAHLLGV